MQIDRRGAGAVCAAVVLAWAAAWPAAAGAQLVPARPASAPVPAFALAPMAVPEGEARLHFLGPSDTGAYLGQAGYCGAMDSLDSARPEGQPLPVGQRSWLRLRAPGCVGDFSFLPTEAGRYVVWAISRPCVMGLYRENADGRFVREPKRDEPRRSCLLPWNHGVPPERGASGVAG